MYKIAIFCLKISIYRCAMYYKKKVRQWVNTIKLHGDYSEFMCFVWPSKESVTFALCIINRLVFITEVESV